jgi:hypothetical protein
MSEKFIIIGDIQAKKVTPYWEGLQNLMEHLVKKYSDYHMIASGDLFEHASPHEIVFGKMLDYFKSFKSFHSPVGNHSFNYIKGCPISIFNKFDTVNLYQEVTEKEIGGLKFLFVPFSYSKEIRKSYNDLEGTYDVVVPHLTDKNNSFGSDEYWSPKVKANLGIFWGHIHIGSDFEDDLGNSNHVIGVPQACRSLEEPPYNEPRIFVIEDGKVREEKLPIYMTIKTIKYGEEVEDTNHLYNVIDAPDYVSVKEKYKDLYIRQEGIEIKEEEALEGDEPLEDTLDFSNIKKHWKIFCQEKGIDKNIYEKGIEKIEEEGQPC